MFLAILVMHFRLQKKLTIQKNHLQSIKDVEKIIRDKIVQVLNRKFITCKNKYIVTFKYDRFLCNANMFTFPVTNFDFNKMSRN